MVVTATKPKLPKFGLNYQREMTCNYMHPVICWLLLVNIE